MWQKTIVKSLEIIGNSLFNNTTCKIILHPDKPNTGISYSYKGIKNKATIKNLLIEPVRTTSLQYLTFSIRTIEHLQAALFGLSIDNVVIEIFGESIPDIVEGKLINFGELLVRNGILEQDVKAEYYKLPDTSFSLNESYVYINKAKNNELVIEARIEFPLPIGIQKFTYNHSTENYLTEISWARTFLRTDIKHRINFNPYLINDFNSEGEIFWDYIIRALKGLPSDPINSDVLCYQDNGWVKEPYKQDEPVRHKILDILGDLSLLNMRICGRLIFNYPGHVFNQELCKLLHQNFA